MAANDSTAAKRAPKPERGPQSPRFIVIEGPLRVGKTTLAKILAERLHARRIYDCEDNPFLADFYNEKAGAAFRAQMYFLIERQKRIREALAVEAPGPVLSDFLIEKDRIFANLNLDDEELKLYDRYYESLTADIPAPDLVIYLQAKPEVLRARIAKKASRDESQISPEYIEEVAAPTNTSSSATPPPTSWSSTPPTSISSSAAKTSSNSSAASKSPSKAPSTSSPSAPPNNRLA